MRGFARLSAAVPECRVTGLDANREAILRLWKKADQAGTAVLVFPELSLSAYTARDLFLNHHLLERTQEGLISLVEESKSLSPMAAIGLPIRFGSSLYNAAAIVQRGKILGVVPKAYLPNYREFEEARWFRPGIEVPENSSVQIALESIPFGTDLLFESRGNPDLVVGFEICEDFWVQIPPSSFLISSGATVIGNLSASNFLVGKADIRRMLARSISDRGKCAYIYSASGPGESSTDVAFDADAFIFENGRELVHSQRFDRGDQLMSADVDIEALIRERISTTTFGDCAKANRRPVRRIAFESNRETQTPLLRYVPKHPFCPSDPKTMAERCWEIFEIQGQALVTRVAATGCESLILGVSGGLDSTQAALVCASALDILGWSRDRLISVTMPGLGTTSQTRSLAEDLAQALKSSFREIPIKDISRLVLKSVNHMSAVDTDSVDDLLERLKEDSDRGDITFENVQARLRTLLLMTLANQHNGLVIGTGDLSEKALGWATYAGDQIAMYDVNCGVPKTLIQFVIRWVANEKAQKWSGTDKDSLVKTLYAILNTPISPELLPADAEDKITQLTEATIGPYELHDFYAYHHLRYGARPERILELALIAFDSQYTLTEQKKWLKVFYTRFFNHQFKRSCTADGPKVGMVALSPRGDWRMPSDADVKSWVEAVEAFGAA